MGYLILNLLLTIGPWLLVAVLIVRVLIKPIRNIFHV